MPKPKEVCEYTSRLPFQSSTTGEQPRKSFVLPVRVPIKKYLKPKRCTVLRSRRLLNPAEFFGGTNDTWKYLYGMLFSVGGKKV